MRCQLLQLIPNFVARFIYINALPDSNKKTQRATRHVIIISPENTLRGRSAGCCLWANAGLASHYAIALCRPIIRTALGQANVHPMRRQLVTMAIASWVANLYLDFILNLQVNCKSHLTAQVASRVAAAKQKGPLRVPIS